MMCNLELTVPRRERETEGVEKDCRTALKKVDPMGDDCCFQIEKSLRCATQQIWIGSIRFSTERNAVLHVHA